MNGMSQSRTVIQKSYSKLLLLASFCWLFAMIGVSAIQGELGGSRGETPAWMDWLGVILFGWGATFFTYRLFFGHHETIELSPEGFWDKRVSKEVIPWSAVSHISVRSIRRFSFLTIRLTDEAIQQKKFTPVAPLAKLRRNPFAGGIAVISIEVEGPSSDLLKLFQKYFLNYSSTKTDDTTQHEIIKLPVSAYKSKADDLL